MKLLFYVSVITVIWVRIECHPKVVNQIIQNNDADDDMKVILAEYNRRGSELCNANAKANWDVNTNVGVPELEEIYQKTSNEFATWQKEQHATHFKDAIIDDYTDESIKRQLSQLKEIGTSALATEKYDELTNVRLKMSNLYSSAKICPFEDESCATPSWSLDAEIEERMSKSRDYQELEYIWTEWHEKSGKLMRSDYKTYRDLMNEAGLANGHADAGAMWVSVYEDANFKEIIDDLWLQVEPLYNELHTYVKNQLSKIYPEVDKTQDTIPAHILGNMWAQNWGALYEDIKPFKNGSSLDVTEKILSLGWTVEQMFEQSNNFFKSMGLEDNSMSYQVPPAMIEKPEDKIVTCHASAWDFCDGEDFRIKMCTHLNMEDFLVVHHEMGHIQYDILYKDLPSPLRGAANPGFHEAVGDTIALSVSTPKHLIEVGLLDQSEYADTEEDNINALFKMALERVAFLPFGLLIDKWRWEMFADLEETHWNTRWWELRAQYQKISPPITRTEESFDPGAKFHVPASSQYIAYFVAHMLEFQFYESLCIAAGEYNPTDPESQLHKCDFYNSQPAGAKLRAGLELGKSKPWPEALEALTGRSTISADSILNYFRPLQEFLEMENQNEIKREEARVALTAYNTLAPQECNLINVAAWNTNTDVESEEKRLAYIEASSKYAEFVNQQATHFDNYDLELFADDESVYRQLREIKNKGTSVLNKEDLDNLVETTSKMEDIYNTATVCAYNDPDCTVKWTLDPHLDARLAESDDYDELVYVWKEWRDNSGKKMRNMYKTYVELNNKAAQANGRADYGEVWREMYEDPDFEQNVDNMWQQVKPLYDELHTYVRNKIYETYGDKIPEDVKEKKLIPAHLLGNMWAQSWVTQYDRLKPFENGSLIDVTQALLDQGYTPLKMFELSDKFYQDLGLPRNEMSYTGPSIIVKPTDRIIACHASAWDMCTGTDFRVKMCTNVNMEDFVTVHHEMGHINYYILYADQPQVFRDGANPGFHEAVGDLIALSVSTPKHLEKIGLLTDYADSDEDNINALFRMALERVAFIPFGLLIDKWRWNVFSGKIPEENWNAEWWKLREEYQKVVAPVERTEDDFDPGAKYHVPADSKYMSYFISHILEFQLHRALCLEVGEYDPNDPNKPLHKCDIDGKLVAGDRIREGLKLGYSRHWSVALEAMTGETEISGEAIMEYFKPLYDYLKEENDKGGSAVIVLSSVLMAVVVFGQILNLL